MIVMIVTIVTIVTIVPIVAIGGVKIGKKITENRYRQ